MGLFRNDGCIVSFDSIAWRVFYPACCLFCLIGGRLDRRWMIGSEKIVDSSCASGLMVDRSELSVLVVNDLAVAMTHDYYCWMILHWTSSSLARSGVLLTRRRAMPAEE